MAESSELAVRSIHLWLNDRLKKHGLWCYDFSSDLSDGVLLYQLLQAEETAGHLAVGATIVSVGLLRRGGSSRAREANLRLVLKYLENHGVECGFLEQMIPDIAGPTSQPAPAPPPPVAAAVDAESGSSEAVVAHGGGGEVGTAAEESDDSTSSEENGERSEVEPVLLLVWKVFEHLRGRQALFGTPLPASPKAFATHMLVWAQAQAAANSETNSGFPTRVPGNLTTRLVAVFFLFAIFFFSAGGKLSLCALLAYIWCYSLFSSWLDGEALWYLVQSSGLRLAAPPEMSKAVVTAGTAGALAQQAVDAAWTVMQVPRTIEPLEVS